MTNFQKASCQICGGVPSVGVHVCNPDTSGGSSGYGMLADLCAPCNAMKDRDDLLKQKFFASQSNSDQNNSGAAASAEFAKNKASYIKTRDAWKMANPDKPLPEPNMDKFYGIK